MMNNSNEKVDLIMPDEWQPYEGVDFTDATILQYHIDTRDFHCVISREPVEKQIDFAKLNKQPEKFYHNAEETLATINRFFNESGGRDEWRMFSLDGDGHRASAGWEMKYIRIYRMPQGLIFFNNRQYALSKNVLSSRVNQKYLRQ